MKIFGITFKLAVILRGGKIELHISNPNRLLGFPNYISFANTPKRGSSFSLLPPCTYKSALPIAVTASVLLFRRHNPVKAYSLSPP
ncbi:hypothetical protein Csa_014094 [Cucumis sativus]|uniref:Uncharacterized protein n=1 Tax=Cucumis sativus TaxID=3659 RepID=A0A0A0LRQ3_CUCSA|nr:hypothetical protein Csa_014094 [Cucumis sativus]